MKCKEETKSNRALFRIQDSTMVPEGLLDISHAVDTRSSRLLWRLTLRPQLTEYHGVQQHIVLFCLVDLLVARSLR